MNALLPFALLALAACSDPCAESIDQAFLDGEAAKEGAVRTESGLIYQELKAGYGPNQDLKPVSPSTTRACLPTARSSTVRTNGVTLARCRSKGSSPVGPRACR